MDEYEDAAQRTGLGTLGAFLFVIGSLMLWLGSGFSGPSEFALKYLAVAVGLVVLGLLLHRLITQSLRRGPDDSWQRGEENPPPEASWPS